MDFILETICAALIVIGAAVFLFRRLINTTSKPQSKCGSCSLCDSCHMKENRDERLKCPGDTFNIIDKAH